MDVFADKAYNPGNLRDRKYSFDKKLPTPSLIWYSYGHDIETVMADTPRKSAWGHHYKEKGRLTRDSAVAAAYEVACRIVILRQMVAAKRGK